MDGGRMNMPMNVTETVAFGAQRIASHPELGANARRDAELLLRFVLGVRREELLANPQREIRGEERERFEGLIVERAAGKPVQYITGVQHFWGLEFAVTPAVLIPRPETEHLVEAALALLGCDDAVRVIDVGTGSGAIAIAIAHDRPAARITAIDISRDALAVARGNAERHHVAGRIRFVEGDLLDGIADAACDMIVANPPYVAESERSSLAVEVRDYEPAAALFAGATGYAIYERLIPQAARVLRPEGWLLLEIGVGQQVRIEGMLTENGFAGVRFVDDLQSIPRVVIAQRDAK